MMSEAIAGAPPNKGRSSESTGNSPLDFHFCLLRSIFFYLAQSRSPDALSDIPGNRYRFVL